MDIDDDNNRNKVYTIKQKNSTIVGDHNNSPSFLEKKNQIVPFNNRKLVFKEDLEKKFSSLYVLNFLQNDDLFDYLKSIMKIENKDESADNYELEGSVTKSKSKKISTVKDCKYLYMIVENPNNKQETFELGLKVIDIVPNYKH